MQIVSRMARNHYFEVRRVPLEEIMQKIGLIAATVVVLSFCSVEAWAQQSKPLSGPAYEKDICGCRVTAKYAPARWPDCMAR
jgi:hypothetical protein